MKKYLSEKDRKEILQLEKKLFSDHKDKDEEHTIRGPGTKSLSEMAILPPGTS